MCIRDRISSSPLHEQQILILDFGSQYTQNIARKVREAHVFCEIHPCTKPLSEIKTLRPKGIILSGGPASVLEKDAFLCDKNLFELGIPILGICYGMQTMAVQLGGDAKSAKKAEFGFAKIRARNHSKLLSGINDEINSDGHGLLDVWMSHGIEVTKLPPGFELIASSENCPIAGFANQDKNYYGLQFHPEVTHTKQGIKILERFITNICLCEKKWTTENIIDDLLEKVKVQVGKQKVLLGLSGGVDSSVVAILLQKAIGNQLTCVFVDNGLLSLNEGDEVMKTFSQNLGVKVIRADAQQYFYDQLSNESDPELKRKIIGRAFIEIFNQEAKKLKDIKFLAQGTIYPDVIESAGAASGKAKVIKSHHNVGGLPDNMHFKLVEPLKELFKDEVRKLGVQLSLSKDILYRHPFPGPGLAIRIPGEVTEQKIKILQDADSIFINELKRTNYYSKIWQAYAALLPVKTVGVMGDSRTYEYICLLRAITSEDGMTADFYEFKKSFMETISNQIVNSIRGINRVVYDITSKPPSTIELE